MDSNFETILTYNGKFVDRNPDIKAAGYLTNSGSTVGDCLLLDEREPYGYVKKFLRSSIYPVGRATLLPGRVADHCNAANIRHGIRTSTSEPAVEVIYPNDLSTLESIQKEIFECKVYPNRKKSYKTICQEYSQETYGKKIDRSEPLTINPGQNQQENLTLKEKQYEVGKHLNRKYNDSFVPTKRFGKHTHSRDGKNLKNLIHESSVFRNVVPVSLRLEQYREKTFPKLGETLKPYKSDPPRWSYDHTFGKVNKNDSGLFEDIARNPIAIKQTRDILETVSSNLLQQNFDGYDTLLESCRRFDRAGNGLISLVDMRAACNEAKMPISMTQLTTFLHCCDLLSPTKTVDYEKFHRFVNPSIPIVQEPNASTTAIAIGKGDGLKTSSLKTCDCESVSQTEKAEFKRDMKYSLEMLPQKINDIVSSLSKTQSTSSKIRTPEKRLEGQSRFGLPTVRRDRLPPKTIRIDDLTNYGDDANAYSLIFPSIYTKNGITQRDMLQPRSKKLLFEIFSHLDPRLDMEMFDKVFEIAVQDSCDCTVSIEGMRKALDNL